MKYLYIFGFCTPTQWVNNDKHGWDDEDSYALFIKADSEEEALKWGQEVSEQFVFQLFKQAGWKEPIPSWKEANFANWIEHKPLDRFSGLALDLLPSIECSELPNIDEWISDSLGESYGSKKSD